jgi:hypothetical protein
MARRTIVVSDLTGNEIDERFAAQVIINYADARRGRVVLDVNANEVDDLAAKGTRQARRGRKPRTLLLELPACKRGREGSTSFTACRFNVE